MELKHDPELGGLLREWKAPDLPASLDARVLGPRRGWWQVMLRGYIRVPVPVACCLAVLILAGAWRLARPSPNSPCSSAIVQTPARASAPAPDQKTSCAPGSRC